MPFDPNVVVALVVALAGFTAWAHQCHVTRQTRRAGILAGRDTYLGPQRRELAQAASVIRLAAAREDAAYIRYRRPYRKLSRGERAEADVLASRILESRVRRMHDFYQGS